MPWGEKVKNNFGVGKKAVPKVVGEVRVGVGEQGDVVVFSRPNGSALSAGLVLLICGGTNCTGNRCERKYSLHS